MNQGTPEVTLSLGIKTTMKKKPTDKRNRQGEEDADETGESIEKGRRSRTNQAGKDFDDDNEKDRYKVLKRLKEDKKTGEKP